MSTMTGDMPALLAALPEPVRARIERAGVPAADLARLLSWPAEDGVLFVGSLADGTGGRESDLDFVVLHDDDRPFPELIADRALAPIEVTRSTLVNRVLAVREGIEFDVWVVHREQVVPLREVLDASIGPDGELIGVPGLQYLEAKLLTRLYTGTAVQGAPAVRAWRDRLHVRDLPAIRIAGGVVGALSFLEDSWSIGALDRPGDGDRVGAMVAARSAAEHLLAAALAARGVLTWDLRYARAHRDALRSAGPLSAPLEHLEDLLLPVGDDADAFARAVHADLAALVPTLTDDAGRRALAYLRTFAPGRFALDLGFLEPPAGSGSSR